MTKQQCFSLLRNQKKQLFNFYKVLRVSYKMETQKIINLLNDSSNEESNWLQKSGMSQTAKQQKVITSKEILLNLKQKLLNQVFVIILMRLF